MNLRWIRDRQFCNCWDLMADARSLGFTIQTSGSEDIEWCPRYGSESYRDVKYPGRTIDEVKAIVEALVLLEG